MVCAPRRSLSHRASFVETSASIGCLLLADQHAALRADYPGTSSFTPRGASPPVYRSRTFRHHCLPPAVGSGQDRWIDPFEAYPVRHILPYTGALPHRAVSHLHGVRAQPCRSDSGRRCCTRRRLGDEKQSPPGSARATTTCTTPMARRYWQLRRRLSRWDRLFGTARGCRAARGARLQAAEGGRWAKGAAKVPALKPMEPPLACNRAFPAWADPGEAGLVLSSADRTSPPRRGLRAPALAEAVASRSRQPA